MPLVKCSRCATVNVRSQRGKYTCDACRAATLGDSVVRADAEKQCSACGKLFTPANARQRFCQRKACKPTYVPSDLPRALAPVAAARALTAAAGALFDAGCYDVYQSLTGINRCALLAVYSGKRLLIEVQTAVSMSNGEFKFNAPKSPDSDIRAYVGRMADGQLSVTFDPPVDEWPNL